MDRLGTTRATQRTGRNRFDFKTIRRIFGMAVFRLFSLMGKAFPELGTILGSSLQAAAEGLTAEVAMTLDLTVAAGVLIQSVMRGGVSVVPPRTIAAAALRVVYIPSDGRLRSFIKSKLTSFARSFDGERDTK